LRNVTLSTKSVDLPQHFKVSRLLPASSPTGVSNSWDFCQTYLELEQKVQVHAGKYFTVFFVRQK